MSKDFTNRTGFSNKQIREAIENWLEDGGCPFGDLIACDDENYKTVCKQVFPKLSRNECPCNIYSENHIIRIARQAVRELGG